MIEIYPASIKKVIIFLILGIADLIIVLLFFKMPAFPRLAMWDIIESDKYEDFYWEPENAPRYFHFETDKAGLEDFRNEIMPVVAGIKDNGLETVLAVARYTRMIGERSLSGRGVFKWSSPQAMLRQIREGRTGANCFHYSIILSTYLSSLGMKSRLWALEGYDGPGGNSHTVCEVYLKKYNKWVLIDCFWGIYFSKDFMPFSVLELRNCLLYKTADNLQMNSIGSDNILQNSQRELYLQAYSLLAKEVFLRTANDFAYKYDSKIRYGCLAPFHSYLDKLPSQICRGLNYLFGRKDYMRHYTDGFDKSLRFGIITARVCFYFFTISCFLILFYAVIIFIRKNFGGRKIL